MNKRKLYEYTEEQRKERKFACEYPDCKYASRTKDLILRHVNDVHLFLKKFICNFHACSYTSSDKGNFARHKKTHKRERNHPCLVTGCTYAGTRKQHLIDHMTLHSGARPFSCTYTGCDRKFSRSNHLAEHMRTHTGERTHRCMVSGCSFFGSRKAHLRIHRETIHEKLKPCKCDHPDCKFTCAVKTTLKTHQLQHSGARPFKCTYPECGATFKQTAHRRYHFESKHSERGQQKRKREEERIHQLLELNQIHFDREVQVDFTCVLGPDRGQKFARIDFVIQKGMSTYLLEIDENEHGWHQISCETRRMMDTYSSLVDKERQYIWVRYNPHAFTLNEQRIKNKRGQKESLLLSILENHKATHSMEIIYVDYSANYNDQNKKTEPVIFEDLDFPDALKPLCSYVNSA